VSRRGEHDYVGGGSRRIRGRDTELSVLAERIAGARAGRGGVVVEEGPPGIGKSRLLAEAVTLVGTERARREPGHHARQRQQ
jgi:hypothetical protein